MQMDVIQILVKLGCHPGSKKRRKFAGGENFFEMPMDVMFVGDVSFERWKMVNELYNFVLALFTFLLSNFCTCLHFMIETLKRNKIASTCSYENFPNVRKPLSGCWLLFRRNEHPLLVLLFNKMKLRCQFQCSKSFLDYTLVCDMTVVFLQSARVKNSFNASSFL